MTSYTVGCVACRECGHTGPVEDFAANKKSKYGVERRCKPCSRLANHRWHKDNPERKRELNKAWAERNPGVREQQTRDWYAADPERVRSKNNRRRVRLMGAEGWHTNEEWAELLSLFDNACAYCGSPDRIERDHVRSLVSGGTDWIENITPACKTCNSSKRERSYREWQHVGFGWRVSARDGKAVTA